MCAQNQLWSKRQRPFSCPAFFCPPVIIRTMLERNIMLAIWPFTLSPVSETAAWCNVLYERAPLVKSSSVKQCSLWEARNCNNKEIERARKAQKQQNEKHLNCGRITTSDCISFFYVSSVTKIFCAACWGFFGCCVDKPFQGLCNIWINNIYLINI